ncbi:unnamed protein product [Macrosiphum euphorbiae]|uniref:Integral membrane protein 2 n=1 Tax=Macrosiphum euphorbiae TaxID=13131 RepID=A0AAV0Y0A5_9HEMI|nr:unnamed protein product [Macrosiphum euphorbiae]
MDSNTDIDDNSQRLKKLTKKLAVMFMQSFITAVFVFVLATFTYYLHLRCKSTAVPVSPNTFKFLYYDDMGGSGFHASVPEEQIVNVTAREFCSVVSRDLYSLEQMGYVDETRRVSKLLSLDLGGAQDVHYVFVNTTHVPWTVACSLESALGAVGHVGRVNVFVVSGMEFDRTNNKCDATEPVSNFSI